MQFQAEVWDFLTKDAGATTIMLPNDKGELVAYSGQKLKERIRSGMLTLNPATYMLSDQK